MIKKWKIKKMFKSAKVAIRTWIQKYANGFSAYGIDELLAKLDAESPKTIAFLMTEQIQKSLKKKRKLNKAVVRKFGKDYKSKKIDSEI